jgi:tetratricopeptide (TPR) repeat protein
VNESQIFANALKVAGAAERAAYLDDACAGDPQLRGAVDALLRAHAGDPDFLEQPAAAFGETVDAPPAGGRAEPGMILAGRFKLLQQIGEGGMGTVWMAEQTEPVQRKVAVKIIKAGLDKREVLARFEAERQALALMDHPHIAKVFDGGALSEPAGGGRPYFVMELVKGQPITRYCDEQRLTPRQRLELFVPVCEAIQHAHQKGIIHRDLKPSNVLVAPYDGRPVVKVIDFGVAKAAGQRLTEKTLFTEFGAVIGTLEYMSPEQAELNNQDIDTRSDIYSLGVLLYELLTGTTPLNREQVKGATFLELLRMIREVEPPRPSTRLSESKDSLPSISAQRQMEPARLTNVVRGELDWIVMKSLEKDRARRYETANGFAADIRRYLADEPVLACPPSAWYRLRKVARRNRAVLTAATLVVLALLVGAVVSAWQAVVATAAEKLAAERLVSERNTRTALDAAREEQDQQRARTNRELGAALAEVAGLREKVRTARLDDREPWSQLRAALRRAETLAGSEMADPGLVGQVQTLVAEVKREEKDQGMRARLEEIHLSPRSFTTYGGQTPSTGPDWERTRTAYEAAFRDYGLPLSELSVEEAARRIAASPIRDSLVAALDDMAPYAGDKNQVLLIAQRAETDPWRRQYLDARIRTDITALQRLAGQPEALEQPPAMICRLAEWDFQIWHRLDFLREAQRRYPADPWINTALANTLANMRGKTYLDWVHYAEEAVGFRRAALAAHPKSWSSHEALCMSLCMSGRRDEAVGVFEQLIRLEPSPRFGSVSKAGESLPNSAYGSILREYLRNGGSVAYIRWDGDLDRTIAACRQAVLRDPNAAWAHTALADALQVKGELDDAISAYRKALELDPRFTSARDGRASAYVRLKRFREALADFDKALEVLGPNTGPMVYNDVAWLLATCPEVELRDPKRAVELAKKAVELAPEAGSFWNTLGVARYRLGEEKDAVAALHKSMKLGQGGDAFDWLFLAMAHRKLGDRDEARKWYDKSVKWLEENGPALEKDPLHAEEVRRFREEAEQVLELNKK